MIVFEKLQQVKEMITQLLVFCTIIISKAIIYYKMVAIKLIQQQALDAYLKTMQQFNFAGNLEQ